jgi:hypothetical protein
MMGYSEELTITEKTIHYYYEVIVKGETKEINDAIPNGLWSNLLNKCDLETFAKTKSGDSNRPVDGLDQVFTIKTKEKEFSVVNGYGNEYEQLYDFFEIIVEQMQQYQTNEIVLLTSRLTCGFAAFPPARAVVSGDTFVSALPLASNRPGVMKNINLIKIKAL